MVASAEIVQARGGYKIGDLIYPRVTAILNVLAKPGLEAWRQKVGPEEADRVMRASVAHGKAVHTGCEQVVLGGSISTILAECRQQLHGEAVAHAVAAFAGWYRSNVAGFLGAEKLCWSLRHRYAGVTDLLVELKTGERAVVDIKTSKSLSETYRLQLRAYQLALAEQGDRYDTRLIVWLPSSHPGSVAVRRYTDDLADTRAWRSMLALHRWQQAVSNDWRTDKALLLEDEWSA